MIRTCKVVCLPSSQAIALAHVGILLNGGFFYIDTSNRVNFGGCFTNGDLFSLCINGMAITVVSVTLACVFILKDFIMAAVNSYSVSCIYIAYVCCCKIAKLGVQT